MKAIKTLVFGMALLLVAGLGLLGYGLMTKTGKGGKSAAAVPEFGIVPVPVPAGSRIEQVGVAGDRVVLRVTGTGAERIVVLDPASGTLSGQFVFSPEAPSPR